ncbi:MAG: UvrD-helicase domain-containing protein [Bacteroidaceae bacterium]|nr:UvrD-helicase domain-containing protein [Bacteroidaceae bacterium]
MMDFINELNEGQQKAVLYCDGPSLVIAGAGSGKTRVLTYKITYLLEEKEYDPWNILALTFTNKAAREMKERIAKQVGIRRAQYLWMGTFHSIFLRILHYEHEHIGFNSNFTVYDASDSKSLIKSIIKEMGLDEKTYKPGLVEERISSAKNRLVTPQEYLNNYDLTESDRDAKIPETGNIYLRYWNRCKQANAMDFDDLLFYTYLLFKYNPDILAKYQQQFQYILVDEYQDTNYAQHCIVLQLAAQHQRVCVVGDDAQSIYSFRGAEIDNILNFTKMFQGTKVFKLEQNYRSTQTIVSAANSLIAKNERQIHKEVFSEKEEGERITVTQAYSDTEEGDIVGNKIMQLHRREQVPYSDIAILYRTNAQSRIFEEVMRKKGIPYRVYGGLSFYQRKEIKDVIAYFRLVVNPNDEEAFKRIINYPARGIGDTTVNKITAAASTNGVSLWEVITHPETYDLNINKGTLTKVGGFRQLMDGFIAKAHDTDAYELGTAIIKASGIINEMMQDRTPENLSRQENIEELVNGLQEFTQTHREEDNEHIYLSDYLSEVSLLTDQDSDNGEDDSKVTIMTVHSAKGLEFGTVFVVGLEENLFPSPMCTNSVKGLEEERRLFYVAITRAEHYCFLSYAKTRFRYGKMDFCTPSRFIRDIDRKYLFFEQQDSVFSNPSFRQSNSFGRWDYVPEEERYQSTNPTRMRSLKRVSSTLVSPSASNAQPSTANSQQSTVNGQPISVGQRIQHERFGIGEVIKVEGTGDNTKATIRFVNAGEKQLLLRFARFKVI